LNDYPEDRALLALKAQRAALEVAAKQATSDEVKAKEESKNIIVPVEAKKDPKMLDTVMKVLPQSSFFKQKYQLLKEKTKSSP